MATEAQHEHEVGPYVATEDLRDALTDVDIVLPSLGVDIGSVELRLVNLERIRPDVAVRLAAQLRRGAGES
ncbi:hypothetical protein [Streptomyces longispororuber]|nr:hypothetical protein [Streptomyces longispororuber]